MNTYTKNPYAAYKTANQTAPKTRQIVMLYEGIIRFLQLAREAAAVRNIEERFRKLTKASDVIVALQSSLDFDQGGEPAEVLYEFYSQMFRKINQAHMEPDTAPLIDEIISELKAMRDVWDEIDRGENAIKTAGHVLPEHAEADSVHAHSYDPDA